jgi:hypothetical protein
MTESNSLQKLKAFLAHPKYSDLKKRNYCRISEKIRQKMKISMYRILTMMYFDVSCYKARIKRVPTFMDG